MAQNYHFKGEARVKRQGLTRADRVWYKTFWQKEVNRLRMLIHGATAGLKAELGMQLKDDLAFSHRWGVK